MAGILEQLPSSKALGSVVKLDRNALPLGAFKDVGGKVADMSASVQNIKGGPTLNGLTLDHPPASISSDGIAQSLGAPLQKLKSLDAASITGDLSPDKLPVSLPKPADAGLGNLNGYAGQITSAIIPVPRVTPPAPVNGDILSINAAAVNDDLNRLAIASANAPLRLLSGILKVANQFVVTVTNTDTLKQVTLQSLDEIFSQQLLFLDRRLPVYAIDASLKTFGTAADANGFLAQYKLLLDEIDTLDTTNADRLKAILGDGDNMVASLLTGFAEAYKTLGFLSANDTKSLADALDRSLTLSGTGQVLLQPFFDDFTKGASDVLTTIEGPVKAIGDLAGQVQAYLKQAGDAATSTAKSVSSTITANLAQAVQFLKEVETTVQNLQKQIGDFIEGVKSKVTPVVQQVKDAVSGIGTAIEQFFTKIEELKKQLDDAVHTLKDQADKTFNDAFNGMAAQIRKLLSQITDILNRPEVQDALKQARDGINQFKTTVDQASLKPVFDLVVQKTGDLETKINGVDVAKMGAPQKVALKVGAKLIEQVKVDQILKPEILEAFEQIKKPLGDLIALLKEKALAVENAIDDFDPGTIVANLVSPILDDLLKVLDGFRPSQLLAPLKAANDQLTAAVQQLDPQKLVDEVEKIYDQLGGALKAFDPAPLNRMIGDAVNVGISQLGRVRDRDLDSIINQVRQAISLQNLIASTGLAEIAQGDFWDKLRFFLGGDCLDQISAAVDQAGKFLADQAGTLDFSHPVALLKEAVAAIDNQTKTDATLMTKRIGELNALLGPNADAIKALDARRSGLIAKPDTLLELKAMLVRLDLAPLIQLIAYTAPAGLDIGLAAIVTVLNPKSNGLRQITQTDYQNAALAIYKSQVSDPIHKVVGDLKTLLVPFKTAITNIQGILTTLTALPAQIDAAVGSALDAARDGIKAVITQTITDLQTFQAALTGTLKAIYDAIQEIVSDFSPYWLLNSFAESDLAGYNGTAGATTAGMLAMARRIASGRDASGPPLAALMQTKLSATQLQLLASEVQGTTLQQGSHDNVLSSMNAALRDDAVGSRANVDLIKSQLNAAIQALQAKDGRTVDETKALYRAGALFRLISDAWVDASTGPMIADSKIRLARLVFEAAYTDDVNLGVLSLHALVVQNVANLYPTQTVKQLDDIYTGVLDKIRGLPDLLIKQPLNDEFNKIKDVLKQNFDISGIFAVLQVKLDGIDNDLGAGLDRLSIAYNHLLATLDQRLAAAA